jgi:ABC-type nitrate/sulfonate/bicarbonate transport system substrate-binding protein
LPVAATLGLGSVPCDCLTALVLNLHGNAITLSNDLWRRGVRDGGSLREDLIRLRHQKTLTFGVVHPLSSHHYLLRRWLAASGVHPDRDVRIVVVPPPQMVANLQAGNLDGFCAGEPWTSVAVKARAGWCAGTSAELEPGHPEKVLMVRREFAEEREEEHLALIAALLEACEFCDAPDNCERVMATLTRSSYVNVPVEALRPGLTGNFDFGHGDVHVVPDFTVFHRHAANEPSGDKIAWILQLVRISALCPATAALDFDFGRRIFRADLFDQAVRFRSSTSFRYEENQSPPESALVPS